MGIKILKYDSKRTTSTKEKKNHGIIPINTVE